MTKILLFLSFIFLSYLPIMSQNNYHIENYGNRSILLSGNVTGSVEDLGLTYYNPARLGLLEKPTFTINAKAYQFVQLTLKNGVGTKEKLSSSNFNGIPGMIAGTFKIKSLEGHHFAYSVMTKIKSNLSLNYETDFLEGGFLDDFEGVEKYISKINLKNELKDQWFGITWSKAFSENFSVGVTMFASIYEHNGSNILKYSALNSQDQISTFNKESSFSHESYGLFWKLGLAWKYPKIEFGINITPPYLELFSKGQLKYEKIISGIESESDTFIFYNFDDLTAARKVPLGIDFGMGIPIRKSKLHLNIDWHNKISTYDQIVIPELQSKTGGQTEIEFTEKLNPVFNYGLGFEVFINPKLSGFLSFSSDYSATSKNSTIFDLNEKEDQDVNLAFDYYNFGAGINLKLNWSHMVFGATFSTGNSSFDNPDEDFPNEVNFSTNEETASMKLSRWRFIIGVNIPLLNKKLEENK